jgi:hypothetical protein
MSKIIRYFSLFSATSFILLATLGGCADIGAAIDCEQMCDELQTCIDGDLNVHRCYDRCEDKAESNKLRKQLDSCTDCLDRGYACGEIHDQCPVCEGLTKELL